MRDEHRGVLVQVVLSRETMAHLTRLRLSVREIARRCACEMPSESVLGCEDLSKMLEGLSISVS